MPAVGNLRPHENGERFALPLSREAGTGRIHILGTDEIGRDSFTRLLYGGRVSLTVAVMVSTISSLIGMTIGSVAGYFRGLIDTLLMRFLDFMASIPELTVLLILTAILIQDPNLLPYPRWLVSLTTQIMGFDFIRGKEESRSVLTVILSASIESMSCWEGAAGSPSLNTIMCLRLPVDFFKPSWPMLMTLWKLGKSPWFMPAI